MKKFMNYFEDYACAIILLVMLILTFMNVIARYVFLASMPFVEELTCLGLMILSLFGATIAAKRKAHLGLSLITDRLSAFGQKICTIIGYCMGIVFGIVLVTFGYSMVHTEFIYNIRTSGMQWPQWIFGIWVVLGGALMIIRYIQLIIRSIKDTECKEV